MNLSREYIKLNHVSFTYGQKVILNYVNLSIAKETSYALIGKSGVGKSTLLNLIAGFKKPSGGKIYINGEEINCPKENGAYLFQELGLFPWQTVEQAVSMPLKLRGHKSIQKEVIGLLDEMKLLYLKDKYPHELSGGERQRVALARTLIGKPDFLLMDEPTSSLDTMTKEEIQTLILREQRKRKITLLFVTHDMEEAVLLGQKILLLQEDGTIQELDNPYYFVPNAKEELGFYNQCIQLRRILKLENIDYEIHK